MIHITMSNEYIFNSSPQDILIRGELQCANQPA